MAVGDYVVDVFTQLGTSTFQPASSVVILLTSFYTNNSYLSITDGTLLSIAYYSATGSTAMNNTQNMKIFINNGHYIIISASSLDGKYYSGVQVA